MAYQLLASETQKESPVPPVTDAENVPDDLDIVIADKGYSDASVAEIAFDPLEDHSPLYDFQGDLMPEKRVKLSMKADSPFSLDDLIEERLRNLLVMHQCPRQESKSCWLFFLTLFQNIEFLFFYIHLLKLKLLGWLEQTLFFRFPFAYTL